jgi:hypothetical protein
MNKSDMLKEKKAAIKEYVQMKHNGNMADYYKRKYDKIKEELYGTSVICSELEGYIKSLDSKHEYHEDRIINLMKNTVMDIKDKLEKMITE